MDDDTESCNFIANENNDSCAVSQIDHMIPEINKMLVPRRTKVGLRRRDGYNIGLYQLKVGVDMLSAGYAECRKE